EFDGLHHWEIGRLLAFENPPGIDADLVVGIGNTGRVAHQAARIDGLAQAMHRGNPMSRRQRDDPFPMEEHERPGANEQRASPAFDERANAVSISALLRASTMMSCCPIVCAAPRTSLRSASVSGASGLTSTAIVVAAGTSWRSSSSRFVPNMPARKITPVTLPLGRLGLATRPAPVRAPPVTNTIGTVVVAALAASAALWLPTITATGRRIKSATSAGKRSR